MQFLYPALTVGFFLALVPLLIHLINMMRHRRVKWAAMEFLLQSYKKHRKWVWLKQLLLLLTRIVVIAIIVAMLAQLVTQRRYQGLFGSALTHQLAEGGTRLVLVAREEDRLTALAAETGAMAVPTDARDVDAVRGVFETARDAYGRVDGAANCIGSAISR